MVTQGRPRKSGTEDAIIAAVAELVEESGYVQLTVDRIVTRAGTNKPAFYRRFRRIADVVPRILASRHGTDVDIDTGSLPGDLTEVQQRQLELFTDPVVTGGFTGWLADAAADPEAGSAFITGYLAPRRAYTSVILDRARARGEITGDNDPGWIADLLTGPLIMRTVLPGTPPPDGLLAARTIHSALDTLGYHGDRAAVDGLTR